MLFLKRLRKRRAKKEAAKKTLVGKIAKAAAAKSRVIFRGGSDDPNDVEGLYASATNPTEDEDDNSSTISSPTSGFLTLGRKQNIGLRSNIRVYNYEEILDLHAEIEDLKLQHEEAIGDKDDVIFNSLVELGFAKEDIRDALDELEEANKALEKKAEELRATKAQLQVAEDEHSQTISDLEETKEVLAALSAELQESYKMIKAKDETIATLEKSLKHGKTGAKVVLGLLTLGALCADEH